MPVSLFQAELNRALFRGFPSSSAAAPILPAAPVWVRKHVPCRAYPDTEPGRPVLTVARPLWWALSESVIGTSVHGCKALPHLLPESQAGGDGHLAQEEGKRRRFDTVRDALCSFTLFTHSCVVRLFSSVHLLSFVRLFATP